MDGVFLLYCICFYLCFGVIYGVMVYSYILLFNNGKRIHFIELHETTWLCPLYIRQSILIQLQGGWELYGLTKLFTCIKGLNPAETIGEIICNKITTKNIFECNMLLDLASGASGPSHIVHSYLYKQNNKFVTILSDLIPFVNEWKKLSLKYSNLFYVNKSLNATDITDCVYATNKKVRSIFGSFHHFKEKDVANLFHDVIKHNDSIIAAEKMCDRTFLNIAFKMPLAVIIASPIKYLYNIYYIFVTYPDLSDVIFHIILTTLIQPIVLVIFVHDVIISCARTYNKKELFAMFNEQKNSALYKLQYFNTNTLLSWPFTNIVKITLFIAIPK
eukprot:464818_1